MKRIELASAAAKAHTNLTTFECIVALLEGGTVYNNGKSAQRTASRIIKLCKDEEQRQLKLYDAALEALKDQS